MEVVAIAFMLIGTGVLIAVLIRGCVKDENKVECVKPEETPSSWYTAEMKADYDKAEAESKKAKAELNKRFRQGMFEAIPYSRELEKAENILFHAYELKKISKEELQTRLKTVLDDLSTKYPNARAFVRNYYATKAPGHVVATLIKMRYDDEVSKTYFNGQIVDLDHKYKSLYMDIVKIVKIINFKEK